MANKTVEMERNVIVTGELIKARRESKEYRGRKQAEKFYISLANVEFTDEQKEIIKGAFVNSGEQFTPTWVKDMNGYVNVSSVYDIPVKHIDGVVEPSIEKSIANGFPFMHAKVKCALTLKDGAIYPKAIQIVEEGNVYDPFSGFES